MGIEQIKKIVDIQLERLKSRLMSKKIDIILTPETKEFLANIGFDPVYGARPLRRAIQQQVLDPLALKILEGQFKEGDIIKVDEKNGELIFKAD